jgi:apolipoprotein D and lipocalin family protein
MQNFRIDFPVWRKASFIPLLFITLASILSGCTGVPDGIKPVTNFELEKYLGTWYEIARLDHSFERNLTNVTANYSLRQDGGVRVLNRGFNKESNDFEEAVGKAYFVEDSHIAFLKVSFFGPFYGSYIVISLDPEYRYALVCGPDRSYFWLLAREPYLSDQLLEVLIEQAASFGFATEEFIYVDQTSH